MSDLNHPNMETLFSKLDEWRHLAGYPLEARVDALIGLFLPAIIEECCGVEEIHTVVIPQFPLKQSDTNRSDRVDFFALSKDGGQAYLVEIKTDMVSLRPEQKDYLQRASGRPLSKIMAEIVEVAAASSRSRRKYLHLLHALSEMGLLELGERLRDKIRCVEAAGTRSLIGEIEVLADRNTKPVVVFIQPTTRGASDVGNFSYITFDEVASVVTNCGELGELLATHLGRWKENAGGIPPSRA